MAVRTLNDAVLKHNNGAWDKPPKTMIWDNRLRDRRDQLLANSLAADTLWGFKDPRTLLTLPFWRERLPNIKLVATFRHPVNVVRSLLGRPGLAPKTDPLTLWKVYNRRLLDIIEDHHCPLVCFDWPKARYEEATTSISAELGLDQHSTHDSFFDGSLRTDPCQRLETDQCATEIYRALISRTTMPSP